MASGSRLAFFTPNVDNISIGLTSDGITVPAPSTVSGAFNIEVFTASPSGGLSLATGYQAAVFVQDAVSLSNNVVQAATSGSSEVLGPGNYQVIDQSGNQAITISGSSDGGSKITVTGSSGDTITGSTVTGNTQLIDASGTNALVNPGPMTITAGAGPTTVWAATGDSITGTTANGISAPLGGALLVAGNKGNNMTISSGFGALTAFNFGTGNNITGGVGSARGGRLGGPASFIDDNYGGGGNTIRGGDGHDTIIAGKNDVITGGVTTTLINALTGPCTITAGGGDTTIWGGANESITGSTFAVVTGDLLVAGNAAAGETIKSSIFNLFAFNLGKNDSVVGSTDQGLTNFIDDNYGDGGSSTLVGGAGATTIIAGASDSIIGGSGALQVGLYSTYTGDSIDLTASGRGVASIRDNSVSGSAGSSTVTGFNNVVGDVIQSLTSVDASNTFLGTSASDGKGGTVLTFLDGSTMDLVSVANIGAIKFTQ